MKKLPAFILLLIINLPFLSNSYAAQRFFVSPDGQEVTDAQTELTWQRCSAGQSWNGITCSGNAQFYTHEEALRYAQTQPGWRLPNVKELSSLVNTNSINGKIFPRIPLKPFWSSSPLTGSSFFSWYVDFGYLYVNYYGREYSFNVLLVKQ